MRMKESYHEDDCISKQLKEERWARKASQLGMGTMHCFTIHAERHFCILM